MKADEIIHKFFHHGGAPKVIHHVPHDPKFERGILISAFRGLAWFTDCGALAKRGYTTVYENRIEHNGPSACFCSGYDGITTVHYDQSIIKVGYPLAGLV